MQSFARLIEALSSPEFVIVMVINPWSPGISVSGDFVIPVTDICDAAFDSASVAAAAMPQSAVRTRSAINIR
ncbi:MAG: hypothetical protein U9N40_06215 [Euryarchaeota archaeon]|nr:hypothetical protein [Euryarchaeota archaeon]